MTKSLCPTSDRRRFPWSSRLGHGDRFRILAAIVAAWCIALLGMAVWTANPVTLNRRQLKNADYVVVGRVVDARQGRVQVVREFKTGRRLNEIHIAGLRENTRVAGWSFSGVATGETYILPLSVSTTGGTLHITRDVPGKDRGTVYPATPQIQQQLGELFGQAP